MSDELPIGPNPCPTCGGEYGSHKPTCKHWKAHARLVADRWSPELEKAVDANIHYLSERIADTERKNALLIDTVEFQRDRIAALEQAGQKLCHGLRRFQDEEIPSPLAPSWVRVCERARRFRALLAETPSTDAPGRVDERKNVPLTGPDPDDAFNDLEVGGEKPRSKCCGAVTVRRLGERRHLCFECGKECELAEPCRHEKVDHNGECLACDELAEPEEKP